MSSHFLFHSEASESVPSNARYAFPTQASRVIKSQVKIPPRTGIQSLGNNSSSKGKLIQIVLPAQGYLNPLESYLRFDLTLKATGAGGIIGLRPINSIHSMFRRLRVLYGSLVLEDIQNYATLVRMLSNVAVSKAYQDGEGVITEGMGGDANRAALHNPFNAGSQGTAAQVAATAGYVNFVNGGADSASWSLGNDLATSSLVSTTLVTHTYCINLASGLLTQGKLLPLKWLANQLTIELELEEPAGFLIQGATASSGSSNASFSEELVPSFYQAGGNEPTNLSSVITYDLDNIYYVGEILEFDSTYDAAFYQGMLSGGVPIKYASWHNFIHALAGGTRQNLVIQERSRSIKAAFTVIRDSKDLDSSKYRTDPLWFYAGSIQDCQATPNGTTVTGPTATAATDLTVGRATTWIDEFQWRVGGRYFPSQPVKCSNGGAEPLSEMRKAINALGDYTVTSAIDHKSWWRNRGTFTITAEFEASNGMEMSGVNAEELADLALALTWGGTGPGASASAMAYTFVHYDAMLIIRPNNVAELVQ